MALSQRPASRFYAAFYRWSRHTQRPPPCTLSSQYNQGKRGYRSSIRLYHTTPLLQQHGQPELQPQNEEVKPVVKLSEHEFVGRQEEDERASSLQEPSTEQKMPSLEGEGTPALLDSDLETQQLQNQVRSLMRKVPGSVAIVTVASVDPATKKHVPMGVAVSSLSTVTLDPPTISFNLKHPSKTLDAIRASRGLFRVHFLAAERSGASMVDLFCHGNHPDAYVQRLKSSKILVPRPGRNASPTESYAPQLYGDAIRATMECTLTHELTVADHVILVAKIDSLESKTSRDPTLIYVDGGYMRADGTKLSSYTRAKLAPRTDDSWSPWDYPLFPGEPERHDYVNRLKTVIKGRPEYSNLPDREIRRKLATTLSVPPRTFGINLDLLIAECKREAGQKNNMKASQEYLPILAEFYGFLTASQIAKVVDRARALVREDPQFLQFDYVELLQHLGVSPVDSNILPSDILQPLRADGLIGPFESRPKNQALRHGSDIVYYEQAEHNLREHLRSLKYENAVRTRFEELLAAIGESQFVAQVMRRSRWRFHVEAMPELFDASKMDIMGEVSQEETRVILRRLVYFAQVDNIKSFREWLSLPWIESMRKIRASPLITGIDIEFFFGKMSHMYSATQHFRDLAGKVDQMLKPWFDKTIVWEALEERVKQFVQKTPLRAMSWSNKDKLAAMGLHWEAKFTAPLSDDEKILGQGHILDTLVAKELKNHYGNGTEEENKAIARYLKKKYNYDVRRRPIESSLQESESKSSSDVMRDAMLASLNVDVLGDKSSQRYSGSWSGYSLSGEKKEDL